MDEKTSLKHDWWAAGVILFQLCSQGKFPFNGYSDAKLIAQIVNFNLKAP
jgi:hypothetical protein